MIMAATERAPEGELTVRIKKTALQIKLVEIKTHLKMTNKAFQILFKIYDNK